MTTDFDLVCVGGGLAGSTLASNMARKGARVLVVEPETAFKDRVRGEGMTSWGAAEARALGVRDLMLGASGRALQYWNFHTGPMMRVNDLVANTPQHEPALTFYHPLMQEAVLAEAANAGAVVRRGASVKSVTPGASPRVTLAEGELREEVGARLIVGADGRLSNMRKWAGFEARKDATRLFIAGVLLEGTHAPTDAVSHVQSFGTEVLIFPQAGDRARAYYAHHATLRETRFVGANALPHFIAASVESGAPAGWYEGARAVGPLATFEGADTWVDQPYRDGVVLVGDAAASSDPSWGQGLSLTLRDVRVLRDRLLATDDWEAASRDYAAEHDRYYGTLHTFEDWMTELFMAVGPDADARRARALPAIMQDPTRIPPIFFAGPDVTLDDERRRRFFGET